MVAIAQLLDRNGGLLDETNLAKMMLDDMMIPFFKENALRVRTDLDQSVEKRIFKLGRIDDFCEFKEIL